MTAPSQRWFSAILLEFNLRDPFIERDAGLFYEGLKANGVDARFLAIGDPQMLRPPEILLGRLSDLANPEWWRQWSLDGVILYSWALPRFTPVADAIKAVGARLVVILDTDGYVAPHVDPGMYLRNKYYREKESGGALPAVRAFLKTTAARLKARHRGTIRHLERADLLAVPSPVAQQHYTKYLNWVGKPDLAKRLISVPYPVAEIMRYDGTPKEKVIVAVGGWARLQKNAPLLVKVLRRALPEAPGWRAEIIGTGTESIEKQWAALDPGLRARIRITGPVPNDKLPAVLQRSRVSLCTSYHESFHLATAEALCCGCSFVGDRRISSMQYFESVKGSGTASPDLSLGKMVEALLGEVRFWDEERRDPRSISNAWTGVLHPKHAAAKILREVASLQGKQVSANSAAK